MNLMRSIHNTRQQIQCIWMEFICSAQEARISAARSLPAIRFTKKQVLMYLMIAVVGGMFLGVGGFAFAAHQEENDSFCASCHTQPESTYYERSLNAAVDLATAHKQKEVRCIDCHSGEGIQGRVTAEIMGAQNAFKWYSGTAVQPAPLLYTVDNSHCIKCHAEVLTENHDPSIKSKLFGPKGHYHTYLTQWKDTDQQSGNCVSCHYGHELGSTAKTTWVASNSIGKQCDSCHKALGRE